VFYRPRSECNIASLIDLWDIEDFPRRTFFSPSITYPLDAVPAVDKSSFRNFVLMEFESPFFSFSAFWSAILPPLLWLVLNHLSSFTSDWRSGDFTYSISQVLPLLIQRISFSITAQSLSRRCVMLALESPRFWSFLSSFFFYGQRVLG